MDARKADYKLTDASFPQIYQKPVSDVFILHAQVEASKDNTEPKVELPPFLDVEKRLRGDNKDDEEKYSAYSISVINKIPVVKE